MKNTYIKLLIGAVLFGTLVALTVLHVPGDERLVDLIYGALVGMGIMHIGSQPSAPDTTDKQAGFASLAMLVTLAVVALLLTGCASLQQALVGYESAAASGVRAADDNVIAVWSTTACATPVSAALRNPQIIPALKVLCMPGGETAPVSLLDAMQAQRQPVK